MEKVLILGYHGLSNCGADARLSILIKLLSSHKNVSKVFYSTFGEEKVFFDAIPLRLSYFNFLYKLFFEIRNCDVLIVDEGSPFVDSLSFFYFYYYLVNIFYARLFGKKIIAYSVDVVNLRRVHRFFLRLLIRDIDLITARTLVSYDRFKQMKCLNVARCSDMAVNLEDEYVDIDFSKRKKIGLVLKEVFGFPIKFRLFGKNENLHHGHFFFSYNKKEKRLKDRFIDDFVRFIDLKVDEGYEVCLLNFEGEIDERISDMILERVEDNRFVKVFSSGEINMNQMKFVISELDLLFTLRFHPFIFSLEYEIPVIGLHSGGKVYDEFCDVGLNDYLIRSDDENLYDLLVEKCNLADKNRRKICSVLRNGHLKYVDLDKLQQKLLNDCLDRY